MLNGLILLGFSYSAWPIRRDTVKESETSCPGSLFLQVKSKRDPGNEIKCIVEYISWNLAFIVLSQTDNNNNYIIVAV